jgi:hypothetical protein
MANTGSSIHRIKVTLCGSKPPIWRRLEVPSVINLEQMHHIVQKAFGWESCHMWVFSTSAGEFGVSDRELGHRSASAKKLRDVVRRAGDRIAYTYDFGDDWEHDVLVEAVTATKTGTTYPRCLSGRRAGPPEDCSGTWGYENLLQILADPSDEEHHERLEWLGLRSAGEFDPDAFNLDAINTVLARLAR